MKFEKDSIEDLKAETIELHRRMREACGKIVIEMESPTIKINHIPEYGC